MPVPAPHADPTAIPRTFVIASWNDRTSVALSADAAARRLAAGAASAYPQAARRTSREERPWHDLKLDERIARLDDRLSRQFLWTVGIQIAVLLAVIGALARP